MATILQYGHHGLFCIKMAAVSQNKRPVGLYSPLSIEIGQFCYALAGKKQDEYSTNTPSNNLCIFNAVCTTYRHNALSERPFST